MELTVNLQGLEQLRAKMRKLPDAIGRRAMRRALRRGGNVIRDAVRENAKQIDDPETRESIAKNVAVAAGSQRRERANDGPMVRVGIRGGAKAHNQDTGLPGGNTTHWRLIEFGTSRAAAQPFMRPAMESSGGRAIDAVMQAMPAEMDKELAKLGVR